MYQRKIDTPSPVIVTPVDINVVIFTSGSIELVVQKNNKWVSQISKLLKSLETVESKGANGRQLVKKEYSLMLVAISWSNMLMRRL